MTFSFNVGGLTPQDAQNQGGGGGTTVIETLSPKNIAGLICCFDGEINSREGIRNTAVNGMQNLVYNPIFGHDSTGAKEVLNGAPTFTAKGCKLGGTTFIPNYDLNTITIEFVVELDAVDKLQLIFCSVYGTGIQSLLADDKVQYQVFKNNSHLKHVYYPLLFEVGKKYHIAISDTIGKAGTTKMYVNGVEIVPTFAVDNDGGETNSNDINVAVGGTASPSTNSVVSTPSNPYAAGAFCAEHTTFYKFRMWNRQLSAAEIKNNYNADVKSLA